jgi:hypothetical protein
MCKIFRLKAMRGLFSGGCSGRVRGRDEVFFVSPSDICRKGSGNSSRKSLQMSISSQSATKGRECKSYRHFRLDGACHYGTFLVSPAQRSYRRANVYNEVPH